MCHFAFLTQIVSIRPRSFFSIAKYNLRDRFFLAFAQSATFRAQSPTNLRFEDAIVVRVIVFESAIFRKAIFMRAVSPSCSRLVPLRVIFGHREVCIAVGHFAVGALSRVKVSRVVTHVVGRCHTHIFVETVVEAHINKIKGSQLGADCLVF